MTLKTPTISIHSHSSISIHYIHRLSSIHIHRFLSIQYPDDLDDLYPCLSIDIYPFRSIDILQHLPTEIPNLAMRRLVMRHNIIPQDIPDPRLEDVPDPSEDGGSDSERESEPTVLGDQDLDQVYA